MDPLGLKGMESSTLNSRKYRHTLILISPIHLLYLFPGDHGEKLLHVIKGNYNLS